MEINNRRYTFIDLFAGCGGLSEGFYRQGFEALAHIEINHWACETLRERMRYYNYKDAEEKVIEADITSDDIISRINLAVGSTPVDIIIGGTSMSGILHSGKSEGFKRNVFRSS